VVFLRQNNMIGLLKNLVLDYISGLAQSRENTKVC